MLYPIAKRLFDFISALILCSVASWLILLVGLAVAMTSKGPMLFWSERVGKNNKNFMMPKFRTMLTTTPNVATHLLGDANQYLTPIGSFLRSSSLDELPQLWCVLTGKMSFVGPRPALYNQDDLIELRTNLDVSSLIPGITGYAQINGRDDLSIDVKVEWDAEYLRQRGFFFDLKILMLTAVRVLQRSGVSH